MKHAYYLLIIGCIAILIINGCDKKPVPPTERIDYDMLISLLSENNQSIVAGTFFADSIRVRVLDELDQPVEGVNVSFQQITSDAGSVFFPLIGITDNNGYTSTAYISDTLIGYDSIRVVAEGADDSLVFFTINVIADEPDSMILISPLSSPTIGTAGEALSDTVKVKVIDKYSNPITGNRILFKTSSADRSLVVSDSTSLLLFENDSIVTRTDSEGIARTVWHLSVEPILGLIYPNSSNLLIYRISDSLLLDTISILGNGNNPGEFGYYNDIRPIFDTLCGPCHPSLQTSYNISFYYTTIQPGIVEPGDSLNSSMIDFASEQHYAIPINLIEQDKVFNWVVYDSADEKSSHLNSYSSGIKDIIDLKCLSCHDNPVTGNNYLMDTYPNILGNGSDGTTPNAITGDSTSLLVQKTLPGGSMRNYLAPDSAALAKILIEWVIEDMLKE